MAGRLRPVPARKIRPLRTCAQDQQHAVQQIAVACPGLTSSVRTLRRLRNRRCDHLPLLLRQAIRYISHLGPSTTVTRVLHLIYGTSSSNEGATQVRIFILPTSSSRTDDIEARSKPVQHNQTHTTGNTKHLSVENDERYLRCSIIDEFRRKKHSAPSGNVLNFRSIQAYRRCSTDRCGLRLKGDSKRMLFVTLEGQAPEPCAIHYADCGVAVV
jgi:hypothetical protein